MAEDWFDITKIKGSMKKAATSPVSFAFGVGPNLEECMLAMHRKKSPEFLVKALKKEGFKASRILVGTATTEGAVLVVTCEVEVPKSKKSIQYYLKDNKLIQKKVRLMGPNGEFDAEEDDDEQDIDVAAPKPATEGPGEDQSTFQRRFAEITLLVKKALAELGADAKPVSVKFKQAHSMGQSGDYGRALKLLDEIEKLINDTPAEASQKDPLAPEWSKRINQLAPQIKEVLGAKLDGSRDIALKFKEAQGLKSKQDYESAIAMLDEVKSMIENLSGSGNVSASKQADESETEDAQKTWGELEARIQPKVDTALKAGKGDIQNLNAVWAFACEKGQAGKLNAARQAVTALEKLIAAAGLETKTDAQKKSGHVVSDTLTGKELLGELKTKGDLIKSALSLMPARVAEVKQLMVDVQKGVNDSDLDFARAAMTKIDMLIRDASPIDAARKEFKLAEGRISSRAGAMQDLPEEAPGVAAPLAAYRTAAEAALDASDSGDWITAQAALPAWESALDALESIYRERQDAEAEFKRAEAKLGPRAEKLRDLPPQAPGMDSLLTTYQTAALQAIEASENMDWIAAIAAVPEWRKQLELAEAAFATYTKNKSDYDALEKPLKSDLATAMKLGAVTPAMGVLCKRVRDHEKSVSTAVGQLDFAAAIPLVEELTERVASLLEARKTYVAERADWGVRYGVAASKVASIEGCGPLDATLDPLKAAFDIAITEARTKAKANDYAGAITKLKDAMTKADTFLEAKATYNEARDQVFAEARNTAAADVPSISTKGRDDGATVLGIEQAMQEDKSLAKSGGLKALLDEAKLLKPAFVKALADTDPNIAESILSPLQSAIENCGSYQRKHKASGNSSDKAKFAQAEALATLLREMVAEVLDTLPTLTLLNSIDPKASAKKEADALKAIGVLDAIKASPINSAAKALAEKKRRELVANMMKLATTPDQIREVAAQAGGDFKESYDRQMALGSLTKTKGESRAARDHQSTRIQPAADAANVDETRRLAGRLVTDDGRLELAALYACNPEELAGDSPSSRQTVRALTRLREDPEAIEVLESIEAPKKNSASAKMVCATLGLPADTEVTEALARQAALSSLMAELRQKDVGSCFATQVAIKIHDTDPKQYLKDIADMMSKGEISRIVNGETVTVPVETIMSDAALETNTIKLTRGDNPDLRGSSTGGPLEDRVKLEEAPAFQAAFETLGVGSDDREAAMKAALKSMQQGDEFQKNQNSKALQAAVANISDDDMRDKVYKTAMAQLEVNSGNVKAALEAAMNTEGVPAVDPVNDGDPPNELAAAKASFDTVGTSDEIDIEPGLVVRQIVMDKVGLTEKEIAKQNEYEMAAAAFAKDARPDNDPGRRADMANVERLQKECASIRPKIQKMEDLKAACYDAFTGGEDNRLLRSYEYTLTALTEKTTEKTWFDRVQSQEQQVFAQELEGVLTDLSGDAAITMSDSDMLQIAQALFARYQALFEEGTTHAYDASIQADEVSADGNSSRGGFYLYDVRGIPKPANWIKVDDPKKYQTLVSGTMMLAWKEEYESDQDPAIRETSRFMAEKMAQKIASEGFVNKAVESSKATMGKDSAKPWQIQDGGFSEHILEVVEERAPIRDVLGTPTDSKDLLKKVGNQLKALWDGDPALKEAADKDPETATVNASNAGVHAFSLIPGDPKLRKIIESANVDIAIAAFETEEIAKWDGALTSVPITSLEDATDFMKDNGMSWGNDWYALSWKKLDTGAFPQTAKGLIDATISEINATERDGFETSIGAAVAQNVIPPVEPAKLQAKLVKVARSLNVPDDMVDVITSQAKEVLDAKDATKATMRDIKNEIAAAMSAQGMDGSSVDQAAVNAALKEPAGLIFADSNWGDAEHRVKYAMVVNPVSGKVEMWQMNEDGSDARPMDESQWVKKEWSTNT